MYQEIAILFIMIIIISLIILIIMLLRRYFLTLVDKNTLRYQHDLIERHCEEVQNMYQQTRGWRHDYHNHIQTMKAYLAMENFSELAEYLNELDTDLTTVDTVIKTGNIMIDAILNSKISLAKARHIAVDAKAVVPKELKVSVSEIELSLIIGNLMDNAMEACLEISNQEQRFIRIYIDILKGQLYLYIINSSLGRRKRKGRIYESTKNNIHHGFGLMRVDKVVEKYHGYLERQDEENVFATEIMLPL